MIRLPIHAIQKLSFQLVMILTCINYTSCKTQQELVNSTIYQQEQITEYESMEYVTKSIDLSEEELKTWYHKDYEIDTIPGISLEKLYESGLLDIPGEDIIVAVLDTKLDIEHSDLKNQIWINTNEIPFNGIDDDQNGYIDDINGWDFLSNSDGEYVKFQSPEYIRILNEYSNKFENIDSSSIQSQDAEIFALYNQAKKKRKEESIEQELILNNYKEAFEDFKQADKLFKELLQVEEYSIQDIDDFLVQTTDSVVISEGEYLKLLVLNDWNVNLFEKWIDIYTQLNTNLDLNYDYRRLIGDQYEDITDISYGSNVVSGDVPFQHSTPVTGVIGANRNNGIGIKGFSDKIKIMPVTMVSWGDETDKDITVAIKYAVDNGAKIINMSWGKYYSTNEEWISSAFNYAAEHDVLLVHASGNDANNNDVTTFYPNDKMKGLVDDNNNYIEVGASTYSIDSNLIADFSNYGSENVDVFAPGVEVYTTDINQEYQFSHGTSFAAPMVSGLAALLRSHFPMLSAPEIKRIIMDSGKEYKIPVIIKNEKGVSVKLPFQTLSKSGIIINAYNAFILAKDVNSRIR